MSLPKGEREKRKLAYLRTVKHYSEKGISFEDFSGLAEAAANTVESLLLEQAVLNQPNIYAEQGLEYLKSLREYIKSETSWKNYGSKLIGDISGCIKNMKYRDLA